MKGAINMNSKYNFGTGKPCSCGKIHTTSVREGIIKKGAVGELARCVRNFGSKRAFLFGDINTYPIAGDRVCELLEKEGLSVSKYIFKDKHLEPDEAAVGSIVMNYDAKCDIIIAIGSGVINDIGKILSTLTGNPYIIIATAPSMDGYGSASSSMARDGIKVTLPTKSPEIVIGDIDILKTAPVHMAKSGLGDMLAKYVSICEWRLSQVITGEYYCEEIAAYIRESLKKCVDNAKGLLNGDEKSIEAVFEGLLASGIAMDYAGLSRPASGGEHYLSHIWDMRGLAFGTPVDLHGIQCGIGTRYVIRGYEALRKITPDRDKALKYAESFDFSVWSDELRKFIGKGAEAMIKLEEREQKYDLELHRARLDGIIENRDRIIEIINEELPTIEEFENTLKLIEAPMRAAEIGIDEDILPMCLKATKDFRDKYVLSRLLWDLGVLDEVCAEIF